MHATRRTTYIDKHRTMTTENRYKTYKNKLTAILQKEKKKYYCLLLQENKNKYCRYLEDIANNHGKRT